jgi:integrase
MNAFHVGSEAAAPWNKGRLIGQKLPLKLNMRRTKATLIYRRTKNIHAVQLLLGHTKLESTVQYLGIELDDALETAEQTELEYLRSWPGLLLGTGRFPAKSRRSILTSE